MSDLISRQDAMDAIERILDRCEEIEAHLPEGDPDRVGYKMYPDWLTVWKYLHQVPSAQPEPVTNRHDLTDDLLSRKAVIDAIYKNSCNTRRILDAVEALPSAQPERKVGKWIYNSPVTMRCDQCGYVVKDWEWSKANYCAGCGIPMRKDDT